MQLLDDVRKTSTELIKRRFGEKFIPSFGENAFGEMMLLGEYEDQTFYMSLSVDNGNIVIMRDGQDIQYWGEQGVDSLVAPKW